MFCCVLLFSAQAQANSDSYSERYVTEDYHPIAKLENGLVNAATFWMEIPKQMYHESIRNHNLLVGIPQGMVTGLYYGVNRAVMGVYNATTFMVPSYAIQMMQDEYVYENW